MFIFIIHCTRQFQSYSPKANGYRNSNSNLGLVNRVGAASSIPNTVDEKHLHLFEPCAEPAHLKSVKSENTLDSGLAANPI